MLDKKTIKKKTRNINTSEQFSRIFHLIMSTICLKDSKTGHCRLDIRYKSLAKACGVSQQYNLS